MGAEAAEAANEDAGDAAEVLEAVAADAVDAAERPKKGIASRGEPAGNGVALSQLRVLPRRPGWEKAAAATLREQGVVLLPGLLSERSWAPLLRQVTTWSRCLAVT